MKSEDTWKCACPNRAYCSILNFEVFSSQSDGWPFSPEKTCEASRNSTFAIDSRCLFLSGQLQIRILDKTGQTRRGREGAVVLSHFDNLRRVTGRHIRHVRCATCLASCHDWRYLFTSECKLTIHCGVFPSGPVSRPVSTNLESFGSVGGRTHERCISVPIALFAISILSMERSCDQGRLIVEEQKLRSVT